MSLPAWFWPSGGDTAPTAGAALAPDGIVLPDWRKDKFYRFSGTFGAAITGALTFYPGNAPAVSGANQDVWAVSYTGTLSRLASGASAPTETAMPSGKFYTGTGYAGTTAYAISSSGQLYNQTGGAVGPGLGLLPAWGLAGNTTLYTLLAAQAEIGTFTASTGATGTIALPVALTTPYAMAVSGSYLAVAGTASATLVSGSSQTAFSVNPANTALLLGVSNGAATVWTSSGPNAFAYSTSVTGIGAALSAQWVPTGTQALVANGSAVEVLGYSAGTLTVAQTLALANANSVAIMSTSTDALVTQGASNQLSVLTASAGTWSASSTISGTPAASCATILSSGQVAIGVTNGVQLVNFAGGTWSLGASVALTFTPAYMVADPQGVLYAVNDGQLAVLESGIVTGTGTWTGSAVGVAVQSAQVAIPDPSTSQIRLFGCDDGSNWTQRSVIDTPSGLTGIGVDGQTVIAAGSTAAQLYNYAAPYTLKHVPFGSVGFYNGSWSSYPLGVNKQPTAVAFDQSGNLRIATTQNDLFTSTTAGVITTGQVTQYAGQSQTVSLGSSSIIVSGSSLYVTTSMPGVLVQVA